MIPLVSEGILSPHKIEMNFRIRHERSRIGVPHGIVCKGRIRNSHIIARIKEQSGQHKLCFIMLVLQQFIRTFVLVLRRILVPAHHCRRSFCRLVRKGHCVRIKHKALVLFLELRKLLKYAGEKRTYRTIHKENEHIFLSPA